MKTSIITVAGISSRFNEGIPEESRVLKAIYHTGDPKETLLWHLTEKCGGSDRIVIVGGYRFSELSAYVDAVFPAEIRDKIRLIENTHYHDLNSGYSLYLGLREALKDRELEELLFVEGDLDIDKESFARVLSAGRSVLTYNYEPIYANKAVVLYRDGEGAFHYAFNSAHGLLRIDGAFSCILNSGQLWKFRRIDALAEANEAFYLEDKSGTNLRIIQGYIDRVPADECELIGLRRWTNCNTRKDHQMICETWRNER